MSNKRALDIDILRGIAIFTMVCANAAGEILSHPHPFPLRLYGSFAAPIFLALVGFMVAFTASRKSYGIKHYIYRGLYVLLVAALVDVLIWHTYPFVAFDVLYVIGFSIPFVYLISKINLIMQILLGVFMFTFSLVFQSFLGYEQFILHIPLGTPLLSWIENLSTILKQFLLLGWFPIFPWIGFPVLGASLFNLYKNFSSKIFIKQFFFLGLVMFVAGLTLWHSFPGPLYTRIGYSELFFPPTSGYLLTSLGVIVLALIFVHLTQYSSLWYPMLLLGRNSLFIYVLHLAIIKYFLDPTFHKCSLYTFLSVYITFVILLVGITMAIPFFQRQKARLT